MEPRRRYNARITSPFWRLGCKGKYRMVKIRLTRGGAKKRPFYHIIVTDVRSARDGRNIERVGYYNPIAQGAEQRVVMDIAAIDKWIAHGAQMTDKVRNLYKEASQAKAAAA